MCGGSVRDMGKSYELLKTGIVNFRLKACCCVLPLRMGVLTAGYFNLFVAFLCMLATADGGITPPLIVVQKQILEDEEGKLTSVFAYTLELIFNAILISGMYRNDIALLRAYIYFVIAAIVTSLLVYSTIIAVVPLLTETIIIGNIVYNGYVILLVRSVIVEIKIKDNDAKNGHVVLYSVTQFPQIKEKSPDVEAPSDLSEDDEPKKVDISEELEENVIEETPVKLETITEKPKEEHTIV